MTIKHTIEVFAWMSKYTLPESLSEEKAMHGLFYSSQDMSKGAYPYSKVGKATIQVEIFDLDTITLNKVEALKSELARDRAESEVRQNAILLQISKLESLEWQTTVPDDDLPF